LSAPTNNQIYGVPANQFSPSASTTLVECSPENQTTGLDKVQTFGFERKSSLTKVLRDERKEKGRLTKWERKGQSFERKSSLRL